MKFNVMIQSSLGATNGNRRFALLGGLQPSNALMRKGVLTMTIGEMIGVLGVLATFFGLGYMIGSDNAKKQPPALETTVALL